MQSPEICALTERDWRNYKEIRLRSLKESPDSFGSSFGRESKFSDEPWKSRLIKKADVIDSSTWVAMVDRSTMGLVASAIPVSEPTVAHMYQMWVDPAHRNNGIGTELINRVKAWVRNSDATSIQLSVSTTNTRACSRYENSGFSPIGGIEPLRDDSDLSVQPMEFKLR
jgi:ribosomal protein S18 acetylase RimI-like enzyme